MLLKELGRLEKLELKGALNAIGEGLRTSTVERFEGEESPEGKKWEPSIRASVESGGKTLTQTGKLKASIRKKVSGSGLAVGTNDIRAATHQFGDIRTIRAKNKKYLRFKVGGQWRSAASRSRQGRSSASVKRMNRISGRHWRRFWRENKLWWQKQII